MLVDYWLAGHLGKVWLRLRKSLRPEHGDLPALCESLAGGAILSARALYRVEDFAATIWLWASGTPMVCFLVGAVAAKALSGAIPFGVSAGVRSALLLLFGIAGAQMATALYRGGRVRLCLSKADRSAGALPLPPGSPGLPRRSDFWRALDGGDRRRDHPHCRTQGRARIAASDGRSAARVRAAGQDRRIARAPRRGNAHPVGQSIYREADEAVRYVPPGPA